MYNAINFLPSSLNLKESVVLSDSAEPFLQLCCLSYFIIFSINKRKIGIGIGICTMTRVISILAHMLVIKDVHATLTY